MFNNKTKKQPNTDDDDDGDEEEATKFDSKMLNKTPPPPNYAQTLNGNNGITPWYQHYGNHTPFMMRGARMYPWTSANRLRLPYENDFSFRSLKMKIFNLFSSTPTPDDQTPPPDDDDDSELNPSNCTELQRDFQSCRNLEKSSADEIKRFNLLEVTFPSAKDERIDYEQSIKKNDLVQFTTGDNTASMEMLQSKVSMQKYDWYFGTMSCAYTEYILRGTPNGTFLVRDPESSTNDLSSSYFILSFRSNHSTLHYRIEYKLGYWILDGSQYLWMVRLINDCIKISKDEVYCLLLANGNGHRRSGARPMPLRLLYTLNRSAKVYTLKYICRMFILQQLKPNVYIKIGKLPLPKNLQQYLKSS